MLELANKPHIQKKLFENIYEVLKGRDPTFNDIPKLKYVDAVLKEILRLHPPVEILPRESTAVIDLAKTTFPKGTIFEVYISHLHKNSKYFENPLEIIPERWIQENDLPFFTFSFGPRNCIGRKFAEIELILILSTLIQRYSFELKTNLNTNDYFDSHVLLSTCPKVNHPIIYKKRENN